MESLRNISVILIRHPAEFALSLHSISGWTPAADRRGEVGKKMPMHAATAHNTGLSSTGTGDWKSF
jgi:hypothetical protein